ncbi:hypothetical protein D3C73_1552580 [compost metagenome]
MRRFTAFTRDINSGKAKGLARKSSAPESRLLTRLSIRSRAVRIMIGIFCPAARHSTSFFNPSPSGRVRSNSIKSKLPCESLV